MKANWKVVFFDSDNEVISFVYLANMTKKNANNEAIALAPFRSVNWSVEQCEANEWANYIKSKKTMTFKVEIEFEDAIEQTGLKQHQVAICIRRALTDYVDNSESGFVGNSDNLTKRIAVSIGNITETQIL